MPDKQRSKQRSKQQSSKAVSKATASRPAAQPAVTKKWTGRHAAAKSSTRKTIKSKARSAPAKPRTRAKQRIAVSHHREEDFKADGLRAYAKYRDLGIADATGGLARAHVIRFAGPCNPAEVSKLHFHAVDFQMVYVLKGWVKNYMEGHGEETYQQNSSWTQPPKIKHMILDYSDDAEVLEIILPADFKTVELTA